MIVIAIAFAAFTTAGLAHASNATPTSAQQSRWWLGLAKGESKFDGLEQRLAARPVITVPTTNASCWKAGVSVAKRQISFVTRIPLSAAASWRRSLHAPDECTSVATSDGGSRRGPCLRCAARPHARCQQRFRSRAAMQTWLSRHESSATRRAYRKEAKRLISDASPVGCRPAQPLTRCRRLSRQHRN